MWQGTKQELIHTPIKELQDFIFANHLLDG